MQKQRKIGIINITLYNFLGRIIFFVFLFFAGFYASRVLSKVEFGHAQYFTWVVSITWLLISLGGTSTVNRHLSFAYTNHHFLSLRRMFGYGASLMGLSAILGLTLWFLYCYVNDSFFAPAAYALLGSQFLLNYLQSMVAGLYRYKAILYANLVASACGALFLFYFLPIYRVDAYLLNLVLINIILSIWYMIDLFKVYRAEKMNYVPKDENIPELKVLNKTSLYFGFSAILAAIVWQRTEIFFIRQAFDFEQVAVYGIALSLIAIFSEPLRIIPGTLLSYFAGIGDDIQQVKIKFNSFFKHFSWLVIFVMLFVFFDAQDMIRIVYTDKYIESVLPMQVLIIGFIPGICSYVLMNMHVGLGKVRFLLIQDILSAVVFLGVVIPGIHYYGLEGAAMGKSAGIIFSVVLGTWYTCFRLKMPFPVKSILLSVIFSVALMYPLRNVWDQNLFIIAIKFTLCAAAYIIVSMLSGVIDKAIVPRVYNEVLKIIRKQDV